MSEWQTQTLQMGKTGPTIGLELNSYRDVLGEAFWSFIEERLVRIAERLLKNDEPLTIWAYLEPKGSLIIHFTGGGPEEEVRQAILDNTQDLGFEASDIITTAVSPSAEPLFGTVDDRIVAFVEEIDPEAHIEGPKGIVFSESEFVWAGYQLDGKPESIEYSLYRIVEDESGSYRIEEERRIPLYFCRYTIE